MGQKRLHMRDDIRKAFLCSNKQKYSSYESQENSSTFLIRLLVLGNIVKSVNQELLHYNISRWIFQSVHSDTT